MPNNNVVIPNPYVGPPALRQILWCRGEVRTPYNPYAPPYPPPPQTAYAGPVIPSGKFTGPMALRNKWHRPVFVATVLPNAWFAQSPQTIVSLPGGVPVTYDATGAGVTGTIPSNGSLYFTHVLGANANALLLFVSANYSAAVNWSVTVGATPMVQIGTYNNYYASGSYITLYIFGLLNPPLGSQTVTFTASSGSATEYMAMNSVSYNNVASFGAQQASTGNGTALSLSTTTDQVGGMYAMACGGVNGVLSGFNQTQRSWQPWVSLTNQPLLIGDAVGGSALNFTATDGTSEWWGAIGVPLNPINPGTVLLGITSANTPQTITATDTANIGAFSVAAPQTITATLTNSWGISSLAPQVITSSLTNSWGSVAQSSLTVTATPPTSPITFDAIGAGGSANNSVAPIVWSHTIAPNATIVLLGVSYNGSGISYTANVGGQAMTIAGTDTFNGTEGVGLLYLLNPPTGTQTVTFSPTGSGFYAQANTVSYTNVMGVGTISVADYVASGAVPNITLASQVPQLIFNVMGYWTSGITGFVGYNQTSRYQSPIGPYPTGEPLLLGDAPGGGATTFSCTSITNNYGGWGALAFALLPHPNAVVSWQTTAATPLAITAGPSPWPGPVAYDATGTGLTGPVTAPTFDSVGGQGGGGNACAFFHTIGPTANCILIAVSIAYVAAGGPLTCTVGGVSATTLVTSGNFYGSNSQTCVLGLMNPPTGSQYIYVSCPNYYVGATSVSYSGVSGFGAGIVTTGSSTTATESITGTANCIIFQAIAAEIVAPDTLSGYTQTLRSNVPGVSNVNLCTLAGDFVGSSGSVTGACTLSTGIGWGSVMVPLLGSLTWTHTATAGAAAVVAVNAAMPSGGVQTSFTRTATYGGRPMSSLGVTSLYDGAANYGWVELFGLLNVPGGARAVSIGITGPAPVLYDIEANSVSYTNVAAFGLPVTAHGAGATPNSTAITTATPVDMIVQCFGVAASGGAITLSAYSATSRWNQALTGGDIVWGAAITLGDSVGAASVTFTETSSQSVDAGASVAIPLWSVPPGRASYGAVAQSPQTITATDTANATWQLAIGASPQVMTATLQALYGASAWFVNALQTITATDVANSIWAIKNAASPQAITTTNTGAVNWGANANAPQVITGTVTAPGSVTYDAIGTGGGITGQSTATTQISWTHTATAGAYVVVALANYSAAAQSNSTDTVTYGGLSMTQVAGAIDANSAEGTIFLFGLANVPGGPQTVVATATVALGYVNALHGNSVSYLNVGYAYPWSGTNSVVVSGGASISGTGSTAAGGVIVMAVIAIPSNLSLPVVLSNYVNGTPRWTYTGVTGGDLTMGMGEADGPTTNTQTWQFSNTAYAGAILLGLRPAGTWAQLVTTAATTPQVITATEIAYMGGQGAGAPQTITATDTANATWQLAIGASPQTITATDTANIGAFSAATPPLVITVPAVITPISFDSVGAGSNAASSTAALTWSQTIGSGASIALMAVSWVSTPPGPTFTAQLGSTTMAVAYSDQLSTYSGSGFGFSVYYLMNPPSGVQNFSLTPTNGASMTWNANSITYFGVQGLGSLDLTSGTTTTVSFGPVYSPTGSWVFNIIEWWESATGSYSSYTGGQPVGTPRYFSGANEPLLIGDVPSGGEYIGNTFGATITNLLHIWGCVTIPLLQTPSPTIISYGAVTQSPQTVTAAIPAVTQWATTDSAPQTITTSLNAATSWQARAQTSQTIVSTDSANVIWVTTANTSQTITATLISLLSHVFGADSLLAITAGQTAIGSRGAVAQSPQVISATDAANAIWAIKNAAASQTITVTEAASSLLGITSANTPQTITATLTNSWAAVAQSPQTITATDTAYMGGQGAGAPQIITATDTAAVSWQARAQALQTILATDAANMIWTTTAQSPQVIIATLNSLLSHPFTGDSLLAVTATPNSLLSHLFGADTLLAITAADTSVGSYGAVALAPQLITVTDTALASHGAAAVAPQVITATDIANTIWWTHAGASQVITAAGTGTGSRGQGIGSPLIVTGTPTGTAVWGGLISAPQIVTATLADIISYGAVANTPQLVTVTDLANTIWATTADAPQIVTATNLAVGGRGQIISSLQVVTASPVIGIQRATWGESQLLITPSTVTGTSLGQVLNSSLSISATLIDTLVRGQGMNAGLVIMTGSEAMALRGTLANTGLIIYAAEKATLVVGVPGGSNFFWYYL